MKRASHFHFRNGRAPSCSPLAHTHTHTHTHTDHGQLVSRHPCISWPSSTSCYPCASVNFRSGKARRGHRRIVKKSGQLHTKRLQCFLFLIISSITCDAGSRCPENYTSCAHFNTFHRRRPQPTSNGIAMSGRHFEFRVFLFLTRRRRRWCLCDAQQTNQLVLFIRRSAASKFNGTTPAMVIGPGHRAGRAAPKVLVTQMTTTMTTGDELIGICELQVGESRLVSSLWHNEDWAGASRVTPTF
jgi:hypothetical protein